MTKISRAKYDELRLAFKTLNAHYNDLHAAYMMLYNKLAEIKAKDESLILRIEK